MHISFHGEAVIPEEEFRVMLENYKAHGSLYFLALVVRKFL